MIMFTWLLYRTVRFSSSSVAVRGKKIKVLIADTFAKQMVGLMYRESLKGDEGMLFVFGRDSKWGIWMANMKFSIDIVWIGKDLRIVGIKKDAAPCVSIFNCQSYVPAADSRYVLELPAGSASRRKLAKGDKVTYQAR